MVIEKIKLSKLKPAPYNPRKSNEKQEAELKASLEKFGVVEPIIFNKQTGYIVGGHFRVRELQKLGYKEVDCVVVDLNEADEKELNIRLNANTGDWEWSMFTDWDNEQLKEWGLEVPEFKQPIDFSEKNEEIDIDSLDATMTIKLNYTEDEYWKVKEQLSQIAATPEQAVWKLLGNE